VVNLISKKTVDECLYEYLNSKDMDKEVIDKIMGGLHTNVKKQINKKKDAEKKYKEKEKERERKERKKAKISHGTSCPRIITDIDLVAEM